MKKRNFSAEFKRESAQLVVDLKYTVADAAKAMDVGLSTMTRWVKQLRDERQGKTPKASPITPEQIEIRKLRKKLQRIEMENEILKKATVDSICQCNTPFNYLFRCFELQCGAPLTLTMIWQPEFTDKTLSRKPGAVQYCRISPFVFSFVPRCQGL